VILMKTKGQAKVLTSDEFKRLLRVANEGKWALRNLAMIHCSFGLGLRAKEIASLTIGDVCDEGYNLLEEISLTHDMTKGGKQRYVYPVNARVKKFLSAYLESVKGKPFSRALFETQKKSRFTPNAMQKWFAALFKSAGITGASSHSGRRTYINTLIEEGVDIKSVSALAGHSKITTTAIEFYMERTNNNNFSGAYNIGHRRVYF